MKGVIIVKPGRCLGCRACETACALEHSASKSLYDAIMEDPQPASRVEVVLGECTAAPLQCRQCADAPCVEICPKNALSRPDADSPIALDHDLCTKCKLCIMACPFGVIRFDEQAKIIVKCDQCSERLRNNELPACAPACPTGALCFSPKSEADCEKREPYLVLIRSGCESEDE